MKLATLRDGSRESYVHLISQDIRFMVSAVDIAPTLQAVTGHYPMTENPLEFCDTVRAFLREAGHGHVG